MIPLQPPVINGIVLSHAELRAIHSECRQAMRDATATTTLDSKPLPVQWRTGGWRYHIRPLRRDRAGLLLVAILVRGPGLTGTYVRRVRLVQARTLDERFSVEVARDSGPSHT